jgi:multiple sugar transport system ATP-binding protein
LSVVAVALTTRPGYASIGAYVGTIPAGGMAQIVFEKVSKRYADGPYAVQALDLAIDDGEFLVLVGPSGCGKSTALRMVAGLEDISEGRILVDGAVANELSPRERNIAMVFQSYALYPHLTVAENIGFGLKVRGVGKTQIDAKVKSAAEILELSALLTRKPAQLSGGQRQRVAMGRAIVREPHAFLMDEPLSNLDARLRVQMRAEIARIQKMTGVTTLYVTHDQIEAMTMGDRVAVMNHGVLQQLAPPRALYHDPVNLFVASFIGSPAINLLEGALEATPEGIDLLMGSQRLKLPQTLLQRKPSLARHVGQAVAVGLRPEALSLCADQDGAAAIVGEVAMVEDLGASLLVHLDVDARPPRLDRDRLAVEDDADDLGRPTTRARLRVLVDGLFTIHKGERALIHIDLQRLHLFDVKTGSAIGSH